MKTETITIPAFEVRKGDVTPWGTVENCYGFYAHRTAFKIGEAEVVVNDDAMIVVTRPLPDPCPRGRMTIETGCLFAIDGKLAVNLETEAMDALRKEIARRWNLYEDRTTAEIEAGLEKCNGDNKRTA